jgi:hypothetical protein
MRERGRHGGSGPDRSPCRRPCRRPERSPYRRSASRRVCPRHADPEDYASSPGSAPDNGTHGPRAAHGHEVRHESRCGVVRGSKPRRSRLHCRDFARASDPLRLPIPRWSRVRLRSERFKVSIDSLARRARVEVAIALPDERWVRPSVCVRVSQRLGKLQQVSPRRDHQRREGVPKIVELSLTAFRYEKKTPFRSWPSVAKSLVSGSDWNVKPDSSADQTSSARCARTRLRAPCDAISAARRSRLKLAVRSSRLTLADLSPGVCCARRCRRLARGGVTAAREGRC